MQSKRNVMYANLFPILCCSIAASKTEHEINHEDMNKILDRIAKFHFYDDPVHKGRQLNNCKSRREYDRYCYELNSGNIKFKFEEEIPKGMQIALDYLENTYEDFESKSANKLFKRITDLVIYLAEDSGNDRHNDLLDMVDKKTSIAIYFVGVFNFLRRNQEYYLKKYKLNRIEELYDKKLIVLDIVLDIGKVCKYLHSKYTLYATDSCYAL